MGTSKENVNEIKRNHIICKLKEVGDMLRKKSRYVSKSGVKNSYRIIMERSI